MKTCFVPHLFNALIATCVSLEPLAAAAADYHLHKLGSSSLDQTDHVSTYAAGLNASGQVVGWGRVPAPNVGYRDQAFVTGASGLGMRGVDFYSVNSDSWSRGTAINDAGQMVGFSGQEFWSSEYAGFTANASDPAGSVRGIGDLSGGSTVPRAISADGRVVGTSGDRSFITAPGVGPMSALDTSSLSEKRLRYISANGVNASGQVVGDYSTSPDDAIELRFRSFVSGPNGAALRSLPGAPDSDANLRLDMSVRAINAEGQTVGSYFTNFRSNGQAFLKNADGTDQLLDFSLAPHFQEGDWMADQDPFFSTPMTETSALGLNASGQVVGTLKRNDLGTSYAFITGEDGSGVMEVGSLNFVNQSGPFDFDFVSATGINDSGDFVVNASNGNAYLVTVVPEPASVTLLLAGLGAIGVMARRRRVN